MSAGKCDLESILRDAKSVEDLENVKKIILATSGGKDPVAQQALKDIDKAIQMAKDVAAAEGPCDSSYQEAAAKESQAGSGLASASPSASAEASDALKVPEKELRKRAELHKEVGNSKLKENTKSGMKAALKSFTEGLAVQCTDNELNAALYSNRAHVHLQLAQFDKVVDDCRRAIALNPNNVKTYWRAAKASLHLDLLKNTMEWCDQGLERFPENADLEKLRNTASGKLANLQLRKAAERASAGKGQKLKHTPETLELTKQMNSLLQKIEEVKMGIATKQREVQKLKVSDKTLRTEPPTSAMHVQVGRAFMLAKPRTVIEKLHRQVEKLEEEIPKLQKTEQELEKRKENMQRELTEMILAAEED